MQGDEKQGVCPVPGQQTQKRTVWLDEEAQIVSFHFVDGYQPRELDCCDEAFFCFLQSLQLLGYRFQ